MHTNLMSDKILLAKNLRNFNEQNNFGYVKSRGWGVKTLNRKPNEDHKANFEMKLTFRGLVTFELFGK